MEDLGFLNLEKKSNKKNFLFPVLKNTLRFPSIKVNRSKNFAASHFHKLFLKAVLYKNFIYSFGQIFPYNFYLKNF